MSRQSPRKHILKKDPVYNSELIEMIVNHLMKNGKKSLAYRIIYQSIKKIEEVTQQNPITIINEAIKNATPKLEVKAKRIGGSTYQVPLEVNPTRGTALAIRWILISCRKKTGRTMVLRLTNEFLDASKKTGDAVKKREEVQKMAEANKVFAKFR